MHRTTSSPIDSNRVDAPTPLDVLARDAPRAPAPAFEPSPRDWAEYARWLDFHERVERINDGAARDPGFAPGFLTDADLAAAGLPVG